MTIEIRELVIRAVADGRPAGAQPHAGPAAAAPAPEPARPGRDRAAEDHEALVARCVREVLRALRKSRER